MKDNPVYPLARRQIREYQRLVFRYGKEVRESLKANRPNTFNKRFIEGYLMDIAVNLTESTRSQIIGNVETIIGFTLEFYNEQHQGEKLSVHELDGLKIDIFKEFLLSEFKGKTLDQRLHHAERRLRVNLSRELQTFLFRENTGSRGKISSIISSISGREYKVGGTALRWNSRLVLSESFRAYQFTAKRVLGELGVEEVKWVNSPRHEPGGKLIDEYAEKTYKPSELPEYPYPCNDSYFVPIYKTK